MKLYIITFDTYKNRIASHWVMCCQANNAKEASSTAKNIWTEHGNKSHMFHIHSTKSTKQNPDTLVVRTWRGREYKGSDILNIPYCVDFKTY